MGGISANRWGVPQASQERTTTPGGRGPHGERDRLHEHRLRPLSSRDRVSVAKRGAVRGEERREGPPGSGGADGDRHDLPPVIIIGETRLAGFNPAKIDE